MKPSYDPNRPVVYKDLEEMAALIINGITEVLKGYATKEDLKKLATKEDLKKLEKKVDGLEIKVDTMSYDVSDIKRRVIDLETDRIGRQEFTQFKQEMTSQ